MFPPPGVSEPSHEKSKPHNLHFLLFHIFLTAFFPAAVRRLLHLTCWRMEYISVFTINHDEVGYCTFRTFSLGIYDIPHHRSYIKLFIGAHICVNEHF